MSTVLDNLSSKFYNTATAGAKMAGASAALTRMATALSAPAISTSDNEVTHPPAAQQWAVCTP